MRLATSLLSVALATGCAALKPGAEDALIVSEIVEMAVNTTRAPAEVQRERLAAALESLTSRPDDVGRLRAAVLLATLPPPLRDDARASAMVQPVAERRPETPVVRFAGLLQARLLEHRGADQALRTAELRAEALHSEIEALRAQERGLAEREESLRRRNQTLRAGERGVAEREESLRRQVEALRQSERSMAEREETLRRQVEALRESERSMLEREGRLGTKAR